MPGAKKEARKADKSAERGWLARWVLLAFEALAPIGAVLLFSSWIAQNYFEAQWSGERRFLEQAQMLIMLEEAQFDKWHTECLQEAKSSAPRKDILLQASLKAYQHGMNILVWAENRRSPTSVAIDGLG